MRWPCVCFSWFKLWERHSAAGLFFSKCSIGGVTCVVAMAITAADVLDIVKEMVLLYGGLESVLQVYALCRGSVSWAGWYWAALAKQPSSLLGNPMGEVFFRGSSNGGADCSWCIVLHAGWICRDNPGKSHRFYLWRLLQEEVLPAGLIWSMIKKLKPWDRSGEEDFDIGQECDDSQPAFDVSFDLCELKVTKLEFGEVSPRGALCRLRTFLGMDTFIHEDFKEKQRELFFVIWAWFFGMRTSLSYMFCKYPLEKFLPNERELHFMRKYKSMFEFIGQDGKCYTLVSTLASEVSRIVEAI